MSTTILIARKLRDGIPDLSNNGCICAGYSALAIISKCEAKIMGVMDELKDITG
jgi:hypothetical protein